MTRKRNPPVYTPQTYARLGWFQVARIRERNGDHEGAARARRNARMLPSEELRQKFPDKILWRDVRKRLMDLHPGDIDWANQIRAANASKLSSLYETLILKQEK